GARGSRRRHRDGLRGDRRVGLPLRRARPVTSAALVHVVVSGLATGSIYALVALSLVIVYNATRTLNFAQGEMLMVSTFAGFTVYAHVKLPLVVVMLIAVAAAALLGSVMERVVSRHATGATRGAARGDQRRAGLRGVLDPGIGRRRDRRRPDRSGGLPLLADGPRRDQRLHRGGPGRLWLDARRRRRRHAARRDREPRAALPPVVDQALGALPRADRDPPDPSGRHARSGGAAEGLMRLLALAIGAAGLLLWPWAAPRYFVFLASLIVVNAIVAIGLNLLSGYTNQLSFGHAGFLAVGAYTAAIVATRSPGVPVVVEFG